MVHFIDPQVDLGEYMHLSIIFKKKEYWVK